MVGILLIIILILFGVGLASWLPLFYYPAERWAVSVLLGLFVGSWLLFLPVVLFGWPFGLAVGALAMVLLGSLAYRHRSRPSDQQTLAKTEYTWWIVGTLVSGVILTTLFLSRFLQPGPGGWYSGGSTWGDLALHLDLVSRFAASSHFSWDFSIFYGGKLSYPFLIDFLSAAFRWSGWSLRWALIVPGLLLALSIVQLLFFFALRLFKKAWLAWLALTFFLVGGSAGGLGAAWQDYQSSGLTLLNFWQHLPQDYAHLEKLSLDFSNIVVDFMLPQRGFLFGLAVFLLVLIIWQRIYLAKNPSIRLFLASGVILGLLPFAHVHTLLVLGLIGLWFLLTDSANRRQWGITLLVAALLAAPQLLWQFRANFHDGFTSIHPGWMQPDGQSWLLFWWRQWGILLPLFVYGVVFWAVQLRSRFLRNLLLPLLLVFILANIFIFQPNNYDNLKLLNYSYFGACLLAVAAADWLWSKGWLARLLVVTYSITIIASGIMAIQYEFQSNYLFLTNDDISFASQLEKIVPADSRILTADRHNHPVPTVTGRPIVMGYRGWLWTYGYDYRPVERDVRLMYQGGRPAEQLLAQYQVKYVVIGTTERNEWQANEEFYQLNYPLVLQTSSWRLYQITPNRLMQ